MNDKDARIRRRFLSRKLDTTRRPKPYRKHGKSVTHESVHTARDEGMRDTIFHRGKADSKLCICGNHFTRCDCDNNLPIMDDDCDQDNAPPADFLHSLQPKNGTFVKGCFVMADDKPARPQPDDVPAYWHHGMSATSLEIPMDSRGMDPTMWNYHIGI